MLPLQAPWQFEEIWGSTVYAIWKAAPACSLELGEISYLGQRETSKFGIKCRILLQSCCILSLLHKTTSSSLLLWGTSVHERWGSWSRTMSACPLPPDPWSHTDLSILHGIGDPWPFGRNLEIHFNSSGYWLVYLKAEFMLPEKQWTDFYRKTHHRLLLFCILFNFVTEWSQPASKSNATWEALQGVRTLLLK